MQKKSVNVLTYLTLFVLLIILKGCLVMLLYNWLVPAIFTTAAIASHITLLQGVGIEIFIHVLFVGIPAYNKSK